MKSLWQSVMLVLCVAASSCGDGSNGRTSTGSGGSSAAGGAGGSALGTGGITSGTGGDKSDGGPADPTDARVANADQALSQADATAGANACPVFTPCGGDIVGTWYLKSECLSDLDGWSCTDLAVTVEANEPALAYTFQADGTFHLSMTGTLRAVARYPLECLGADGGPAQTCTDLQEMVRRSMAAQADAGASTTRVLSFECSVESAEVCVCDEELMVPALDYSGTYSTNGNDLTISALGTSQVPSTQTHDAGIGGSIQYCVSEDTFMFRSTSSSSTMIITMKKKP